MVRKRVAETKEQKWVGSLGDELTAMADEKVMPLAEDIGRLLREW